MGGAVAATTPIDHRYTRPQRLCCFPPFAVASATGARRNDEAPAVICTPRKTFIHNGSIACITYLHFACAPSCLVRPMSPCTTSLSPHFHAARSSTSSTKTAVADHVPLPYVRFSPSTRIAATPSGAIRDKPPHARGSHREKHLPQRTASTASRSSAPLSRSPAVLASAVTACGPQP